MNSSDLEVFSARVLQDHSHLEQQVANGLNFIISLLQEPMWSRTISTKATEGRQIPVNNQQEALAWYKAANYLDCRINAYPYYKYTSNPKYMISLVMIDLDISDFKSREALDRALNKSLRKIKNTFGTEFKPPVLWSGNGYHIYIPIESRYTLEERPEFSKFREPTKRFLRFAEWYLSNGKCDRAHNSNVSFSNCMLRIPGSHNSKCIQRNNGKADSSTQIRIISKRNGRRGPFYLMIGSFLAYLLDQDTKETQRHRQYSSNNYDNNRSNALIPWIETLLQTPLADYRKYCIWRILTPYLVNIRRLYYNESFEIIYDWLNDCSMIYFSPNSKIDEGLKGANKGYRPISLEKLKGENRDLYDMIVKSKGKVN